MSGRDGCNTESASTVVPSAPIPYRDGDNPNRQILWMEVHDDPINQQKRNRNQSAQNHGCEGHYRERCAAVS